jgi:hypothetical protein
MQAHAAETGQDVNVTSTTRQDRHSTRKHNLHHIQGMLLLPAAPWYKRWFSFTWEDLTVAGREVKGFVVPQYAAAALLVAIIGAFGFMYQQNQAQREILIRLDQKLSDKMAYDDKEFMKLDTRFASVEAWQDVTNKQLVRMEEEMEDISYGRSVQRRGSSRQ